MIKVMAFGTFDTLHPGHTFFLTAAKKLGDFLVVVISRDETAYALKKRRPLLNETARLKQMEALGIADTVTLGSLKDKHEIIRQFKPQVVALGYDQQFFTQKLFKNFSAQLKIVRLPAFKPELYKSSKLRPR